MNSDFSTFKQTGTARLERFGEDLLAALLYPFQSVLRTIFALALAGLIFVVLILMAQSLGVIDILLSTPEIAINSAYLEQMFMINFNRTVTDKGWTPIVMNVIYAVLTGIAFTDMIAQLRMLQIESISNVGGILPGLFAAGCASCGPGLFALIGLAGAVSFIPHQQTVLRVGGIVLFLFFLGMSGDPRECRID